ncbi:acyl transferase domain-containing protein, partial [Streptomyces griseochromogenes]
MTAGNGGKISELRNRLEPLSVAEQTEFILDVVRAAISEATGERPFGDDASRRPFRALGIYRGRAEDLRTRLSQRTGVRLAPTVLFDHPTPAALASFLRSELMGTGTELTPGPDAVGSDEPIAVVGMACRFPGGITGPDSLWNLAGAGGDAISDFPRNRGWDIDAVFDPDPDHPGTSYVRKGGFLHDAGWFDADFFGLSPREALATHPQQRLLLECAWESFEDAGIVPDRLRGSDTGVFVGVVHEEYGPHWHLAPEGIEGYLLMGTMSSSTAGRLSYHFGFEGPAISLDTACSSSLVALHLACQSLRQGECSLALAAGTTVNPLPGHFVAFSRQRGLSPDGHCKAFGAGADGTAWGEGVGVVLVERLRDAERLGHRVLAVVRGSAVNQDGASNGLTAPNGPAQQRVIRQALANARLSPDDIDAVEAHGTGTALGDPIEAQALLATYGAGRTGAPLLLGSLKSNIGHTQAAAGVAGVMKMVLALQHGRLPRTLFAEQPSPHVDWSTGGIRLLQDQTPWPDTGRPRRAAVSAFGVSGTNAHLILEQAPSRPSSASTASPGSAEFGLSGTATGAGEGTVRGDVLPSPGVVPWVVSGRDPAGLSAQVERLREFVADHPELPVADIGFSLATSRSALDHRAVILAADHETAMRELDALSARQALAEWEGPGSGRVAFAFSGQGAQWMGMGRELAGRFPVFVQALEEVCTLLTDNLRSGGAEPESSVSDLLLRAGSDADAGSRLIDETMFAQAGLFAFEVALVELLASWGVRPDVVLGHSLGEITAAYVAGVMSLEDACVLVAARGRLMQALPSGGAMAAVQVDETGARAALAELGVDSVVSVAAVNGPASVVLSGPSELVTAVVDVLEGRGGRARWLRVSHAFHSLLMEPMLEEFGRVVAGLRFHSPRTTLVSGVSGEVAGAEMAEAGYWVRHARECVRFGDAVAAAADVGVSRWVEVGPDSVLTPLVHLNLPDTADGRTVVGTVRRGRPVVGQLLDALGDLWIAGVGVDWERAFAGMACRQITLPTYAFQRKWFWLGVDGAPIEVEDESVAVPGVDEWVYRVVWRSVPGEWVGVGGRWVVVVPRGG